MSGHVIILDPSQVYTDAIRSLLCEIGVYHITAVHSLEQYVLMEQSLEKAVLIILDIEFPYESEGIKVLKRIRKNPKLSAAPIVIVSELDESHAIRIGHDYAVIDYIVKPFKPERLLNSLSNLLILQADSAYGFSHAPAVQLSPMEYVEHELRIAARLQSPLSLVVISPIQAIASRPAPNDSAEISNDLRQLLLDLIRKLLRSTDQAFLNDSGEILAVLPATEIKGAENALKKIIRQVQNHLLTHEARFQGDYYGVAVSYPQDGQTRDELMQAAFTRIINKKQLEKISVSVDNRMAKAHYIYKKSQRI